MAPQKRNYNKNYKKKCYFPRSNANIIELFQHLLRNLSCWNCSQLGHNRFQCPFPKNHFCSFCRTPGVLTTKCRCFFARNNKFISRIKSREHNNVVSNIENNSRFLNNNSVEKENIVIEFQNDEIEDSSSEEYLDLDTDQEFLDEM